MVKVIFQIKLIKEFTLKSLDIANKKVVLFARLQFMESISRYEAIFRDKPFNRVYVYTHRVNCIKNNDIENHKGSGSMAFAWYIWDKTQTYENTEIKWILPADKTP